MKREYSLRCLYDVNVLIALFDTQHTLHSSAKAWHVGHAPVDGWASCPITQNGLIRILSQPRYPHSVSVSQLFERLRRITNSVSHEFWPDSVSLATPEVLDPNVAVTSSMLTDLYLLSLAVRHGGRLVTFDSRIPRHAVIGACQEHLLVL